MKLLATGLLGFLALLPSARADFFLGDSAFRRMMQLKLSFTPELPAPTQRLSDIPSDGTFEQTLNPSDPSDTRTFKQRYLISSEYASGTDAPVIYLICGETECSGSAFAGAPSETAKRLGAYIVALEHRYYGRSQPFAELSAANLKYLKLEYALSDLERFQRFAMEKLGLKGKWLTMGGSYAGAISAYYRSEHPDLVIGGLASSAPVRIKTLFEDFDLSIAQTAGTRCANGMRGVVHRIEAALGHPDQLAAIQKTFGASDVKDPDDFLMVVADMGAYAMQYGMREEFCNSVTGAPDALEGYARAGRKIMSYFSVTPFQDSYEGIASTDPSDYPSFGARQWVYQSCSELGFFQTAYHDPAMSVRSQRLSGGFFARECAKYFDVSTPDEAKMDQRYYAPLLEPSTSRILFTNGSQDPWSKLSLTHEAGNDTNPNLSYFMIQGGSHCADLMPSQFGESSSLSQAREELKTLIDQWIN